MSTNHTHTRAPTPAFSPGDQEHTLSLLTSRPVEWYTRARFLIPSPLTHTLKQCDADYILSS
nr:MAG TPA: hypothetical protein [Caudoviricetes sp.]